MAAQRDPGDPTPGDPTPGDPAQSGSAGTPEVPTPLRPADQPSSRYDLFLSVASDLDKVSTAYDAELLVSTMLGAAYAVAGADRAGALAATVEGLRRHLAPRRTRTATLLRAVLAELAPPGRRRPAKATPDDLPAWLRHVGAVRPTGAYVFGDRHGDQATYLATFAYADPTAGGPEHVVAAVVDHRLGHVRDLFVAAPAGALLDQLAASDVPLAPIGADELRTTVERHLAATDELALLPEARSLTSDRAFAAHRLRLLPEGEHRPTLTAVDFRAAPEAARVAGADEESLSFALKLIGDYGHQEALRWTPDTVREFMLEWLPARALLDRGDVNLLPNALSAWVRWAGRVGGLSPRQVAQNVAAVAQHRAEFARRVRDGSHRSPAVRAMAQLLADGVDPTDEQAVADWLVDYNAREESGG